MRKFNIGPAFLVTAAFIGPGTVITATLAGANYGYALVWALLFSVIATIILQGMTARLGIISQRGLAENIVATMPNKYFKWAASGLILSAVVIGNGAYQGGNIAGASLGLEGLFGKLGTDVSLWPWVIGIVAFGLLITGSYRLIESALIALVLVMSTAFVVTAVLVGVDIGQLWSGLTTWQVPSGAMLTVIALIGTTVVPYNLFLHTASVAKKWHNPDDIKLANRDLYFSIPIGGVLSIAIVSTAATAFFGHQINIQSAADIAPALEPVFGSSAKWLLSTGLFCAGVSSAVTAPLAAAFALTGLTGKAFDISDKRFKLVWATILIIGIIPASLGFKPVSIIVFAQIANGVMLPLIVLFLLWIMNSQLLGIYKNNRRQNILGGLVLLVSLMLSAKSLFG
ncbi:divalent metal cation transporter [Psychrosphaera sp. B3R10]|nr:MULTISPECIES: divalent metal cation transporter [unclassified Psychrosphaera]MBU2883375.1 divalent metal cation transporter [Psychrosphaera sp. I2R16]MBU2990531.1 divalent metal cation transporter [Psychrosphaera sp. B3R10]